MIRLAMIELAMIMHATDPAAAFRAADLLGRLRAQRLVAGAEVSAALAAAAAQAANPAGCRARLAWRLADAAADAARQRRAAVAAIGAAVAPLLAAGAPRTALERAAADADPAVSLTPHERAATLRARVARALRGGA